MDCPEPLSILAEDAHFLVVAKPPGVLTQGYPGGEPSLETAVKAYVKERFAKPGNVYLGIVHRLDRGVSGALLLARNSKAARRLSEQFAAGQVVKRYWAVVEGPLPNAAGELEDCLLKDPRQGVVTVVPSGTPGGRQAVLRYAERWVLGPAERWIEVWPRTGRTHQIRVQLGSRGAAIAGDVQYGSRQPWSSEHGRPMLGLHCRSLQFLHPISYTPVLVTAPLPVEWGRRWSRLAEADRGTHAC